MLSLASWSTQLRRRNKIVWGKVGSPHTKKCTLMYIAHRRRVVLETLKGTWNLPRRLCESFLCPQRENERADILPYKETLNQEEGWLKAADLRFVFSTVNS